LPQDCLKRIDDLMIVLVTSTATIESLLNYKEIAKVALVIIGQSSDPS